MGLTHSKGPSLAKNGLVLEVQVGPTMSLQAQIIENGPKWVQNRRFGLKLAPEACRDHSKAFGMGLTHSKGPSPAKNGLVLEV